ncbi:MULTISPECIES: hypothetical protein [Methylobacterium]|uniref:Uncharacterized protein n=1 Tax=Methylobacterium jeotgali TaxID=381630 RepID=A0ABQ4T027_9HYPH|nr:MULTISPECIES: hypothetical protein [Methylobacterium]PIU05646.1 MAG: hypothetical protein COT56_13825 [Methylobacterium sp. CG09_land_8_20_14_0_10_71_15]PIU12434.1 MAG: hypothetical protein COT28_14845 [Methylobacterium sp. CG08_land_8_20_14_0_20_71_15]GBU19783.1 hypothetical protein AwMethylo_39980 [Methylobacterium sp.]GJE08820.1 hypothetical protein AOPFMNJM_4166 [Methylobacterium jeotgali]
MRLLAAPACLLLATLVPAAAQPLPTAETTYVETSLNRSGTLIVEHPPVARNPYGRRAGSRAEIAGFCRDGGYVKRHDEFGHPVIIRQREVCDSVAPRTLAPGTVDPRPAWPAAVVSRETVLRSRY